MCFMFHDYNLAIRPILIFAVLELRLLLLHLIVKWQDLPLIFIGCLLVEFDYSVFIGA